MAPHLRLPFATLFALPLAAGCAPPAAGEGGTATATENATGLPPRPGDTATVKHCDVVIAGGSTAALAAARLHPIEWSSGSAAGVAAAHMARYSIGSELALQGVQDIRAQAALYAPARWKIDGQLLP